MSTRKQGPQDSVETPYSWLVVVTSVVLTSLSFGAVTFVPILMRPMSEELGWDRTTISTAHSLTMIVAGIGGVLIGYLSDRINFAVLSALAAAATGGGLLLCARATNPAELYAAYGLLVGGIGQGTFFGPITANVSHWFDRNRSLAMAIALCGQSVGGLCVPVVLRNFAVWWGWRDAVAIYGVICLIVIGVASLVFWRQPSGFERLAGRRRQTLDTITHQQMKIFWVIVCAMVLANSGTFIVIAHLVAFAEEQGFAPTVASGLLALLLGATLISRLLSGGWIDRGDAVSSLLFCTMLLPVGGALMMYGSGAIFWLMAGGILIGLGYGGIFPAYASLVRQTFPEASAGASVSAMFFFGFLAAAAGSWTGGAVRDAFGGYEIAFAISVVATGMSFAFGALVLRRLDAIPRARTQ